MPSMPSVPFMGQTSNMSTNRQLNGPAGSDPYAKSFGGGPPSIDLTGVAGSSGAGGHDSNKSMSYSVTCILFTGIMFVAIVFITIACLVNSLHRVHEGNVAIYYKNGALMEEISKPGMHMSMPFITTMVQITVRPETHYLNPLSCTTYDGVMNIFREVQVISSLVEDKLRAMITRFGDDIKQVLVYDRIGEAIQNFCANNSIDEVYNTRFLEIEPFVKAQLNDSISKLSEDTIIIWNLFIPKPDIPPAIAQNYREVKIEWTKQLVAQQKQKTEKIKKETVLQNALMDAERKKEVVKIQMKSDIEKQESVNNISALATAQKKRREETIADIQSYKALTQAEANKNLLTDQYIKMNMAKALMNNTKMYFSGQDSALGSILGNILNLQNQN